MRFVFLIYVSRSGSTFFARELAAHAEEVLVIPEFRLLDILLAEGDEKIKGMEANSLYETLVLDHQISNLGLSESELRLLAENSAGYGIRHLMEQISLLVAGHKEVSPQVVMIKLGSLIYLHNRLKELFPEYGYLHVIRDPRAVVNSLIHTSRPYFPGEKLGRGDALYSALHWKLYLMKVERIRNDFGKIFNVRYEYMLAEPESELKKACQWMGVSYRENSASDSFEVPEHEASIHKLVGRRPVMARIHSWRSELKPWQITVIDVVCAHWIDRLNYERSAHSSGRRLFSFSVAVVFFVLHSIQYYWRRVCFYAGRPASLLNRVRLCLERNRQADT